MQKNESVLVARHSPFNLIVVTEDRSGLRTLRFGHDGVRQSVIKIGTPQHLELPYISVLPNCLAFVRNLSHILIIGLGGGTLPGFFRSQFPHLEIDVAEIDPDVLDVATTYCGFSQDARMRVHLEDGRDFIERCSNRYDVIILDGFDAETIPRHLLTLEFLQAVRNALAPDGIAVANVWGRSLNRLYDHMLLTYRAAFDDLYIFDVPEPGTKIFVALQGKQPMSRQEVIKRASEISRVQEFGRDFGSSIAGFRNSDAETIRGGEVLRDRHDR
jgi:spermidine synthase